LKLKLFCFYAAAVQVFLSGVEIYNFPDFAKPVTPADTFNTNIVIEETAYRVITNDSFWDFSRIDLSYTELDRALKDMMLRQFYADPSSVFGEDYFNYDFDKRRQLASFRPVKEKNVIGKDGQGRLGFELDSIETHMRLFGSQTLTLEFGHAWYLYQLDPDAYRKSEYDYNRIFPTNEQQRITGDKHGFSSKDISDGLKANQHLSISLEGKVGRKIDVSLRHDSSSTENTYNVQYLGDKTDTVKSVKLGNVNLNVKGRSEFLTTGGSAKQTFGLRAEGGKGPVSFEAAVSMTKGVSEMYETVIGETIITRDVDYIRERYYQLPDQGINEDSIRFFHAFSGTELELTQADFILRSIKSPGVTNTYYFKEESRVNYSFDKSLSVFDTKGRKPQSAGFSILFYTWIAPGGNVPSSETNSVLFFGTNRTIEPIGGFSVSGIGFSNFAVINIPESEMGSVERINASLELRNRYRVPSDIETHTFRMKLLNAATEELIDPYEWLGTYSHVFKYYGRATLKISESYFYFENPRVFSGNGGLFYKNMYDVRSPDTQNNHGIKMAIDYRRPEQSYIDLGKYNIVPNSVVVYKNGKRLDRSEYTINYYIGRISFKEANPLMRGDKVAVHYEYKPFGTSMQRLVALGRIDYNLRGQDNYIGATVAATLGQNTLTAPTIGSEPTAQLVMDVDSSIDLVSLIARQRHPDWSFKISGEYAFSVFDRNRKNSAIYKSMEGEELVYQLPRTIYNYFYCANPRLESSGMRLGYAYFIDYSLYSRNDNRTTVPFTRSDEERMFKNNENTGLYYRQDVNFRPFTVRPGPYALYGEGHLNSGLFPDQAALAFDYEFPPDESDFSNFNYVSFTIPAEYYKRSRDFTRYNTIEIIYKLVKTINHETGELINTDPGVIGLSIDVGHLNEDIDLNGILNEELTESDIEGFPFSYNNGLRSIHTYLGAGIKGWSARNALSIGNGRRDTEDMNQDGLLSRNDEAVTYPSINTVGINNISYFPLFTAQYISNEIIPFGNFKSNGMYTNGAFYSFMADTAEDSADPYQSENYIKITIPLNQSILITNNISAATSIRMNIQQVGTNSGRAGRLVIDSVKFKGRTWKNVQVDGIEVQKPIQFDAVSIDSHSDVGYRANNLSRAYRKTYENLHGTMNAQEFDKLKESALELNYNLSGIAVTNTADWTNGVLGLVEEQNLTRSLDISYYRELKFYTYLRDYSSDGREQLIYRFGADPVNYWELIMPVTNVGAKDDNKWHELTIHLQAKDSDEAKLFEKQRGTNAFLVSHRAEKVSSRGNKDSLAANPIPATNYVLRKIGIPTLYKLSYTAFGVRNGIDGNTRAGKIWVNEIIFDNDLIQFGNSYRLNLSLGKNKPVQIKNTEVLSGLRAEANFRHEGLGFTPIDVPGRATQNESFNYNSGFTLLRSLGFSFNEGHHYSVSQFNTDLLPMENQSMSDSRNRSASFTLNHPIARINKLLPPITHAVSYNRNRNIRFDPLPNTAVLQTADKKDLLIKEQSSYSKGYSLSSSKDWRITKNLTIRGGYSISTRFDRVIELTNYAKAAAVQVYNSDYNLFYPFQVISGDPVYKRNPVTDFFPDPDSTLTRKSRYLQNLNYYFNRDQSINGGFSLRSFTSSLSYGRGEQHVAKYTSNEIILADIRNKFEVEAERDEWYEFYWPELASMWQDAYVPKSGQYVGKSHNYTVNLNNSKRYFSLLPSWNISGSYRYSESGFEKKIQSFNRSQFLQNHPGVPGLSEKADRITNFYSKPRTYRDFGNTLSLSVSAPYQFDKFFIRSMPLSFTRSANYNTKDVMSDSFEVKDPSYTMWKEIQNDTNMQQYYNYGMGSGDRQNWYLEKTMPLFYNLPPYFDWGFLADAAFALVCLFNTNDNDLDQIAREKAYLNFKYYHRFRAARLAGDLVNYEKKRQNYDTSEYMDSFAAHSAYNEKLDYNDSFRMTMHLSDFKKVKFLNLFSHILPNQFSYNGNLRTSKTGWRIEQSSSRDFSTSKSFDTLSQAVSRILPKGRGFDKRITLSGDYRFNENCNYNTKDIKKNHNIGVNSYWKIFKNVDIQSSYRLGITDDERALYYLYTDRNTKGFKTTQYMGIGPYFNREVTEPLSSFTWMTKEGNTNTNTLNIGMYEDTHRLLSVNDYGLEEKVTTRKMDHSLTLNFSWRKKEPFTFKFFTHTITLPQNSSRSITLDLKLYQYELPYVDDSVFYSFNEINRVNEYTGIDPNAQPNTLARKDLTLKFPFGGPGEMPLWQAKTGYAWNYDFSQNFRLGFKVDIAFVQQIIAETYAAYKKVDPAEVKARFKKNGQGVTDNSVNSAFSSRRENIRKEDYVQFGLNFAVTSTIIF